MALFTTQELATKLRAAGCKATPQRLAVYKVLAASRQHPTAENIYAVLREKHPSMSFATVYKALNVLTDIGVVRRLDLGESSIRYDAIVQHHNHVQCVKCGKVFDVCTLPPDALEAQVQAETGVDVTQHEFYFYGLCSACKK